MHKLSQLISSVMSQTIVTFSDLSRGSGDKGGPMIEVHSTI